MAEVSSFLILWFNSRRAMIHRDSVTVQCVLSFRAPRLFSLAKNEAKRRPRFRSDGNAVPDGSRNEWPQTGAFIARRRGAPIRLQSRQRRSRPALLQDWSRE